MEWMDVEFSTNLVDSAYLHLGFLDKVDNFENILKGSALQHALRRYEQLWLKLAYEHRSVEMVPPIDVHWLWYMHMLQPLAYRRDCRKILKNTLDHHFRDESRMIPCTNNAIEIWYAAYPKEGYNIIRNDEYVRPRRNKGQINMDKPSKLSVDLVSLAETHMHFCYQVALPHFRDKTYLANAEKRYKQFLCLKRIEPEEFLTPSVDILLMWYTHMCNPIAYANDLMKICGKLLDNNIRVKPALITDRFIMAREKTNELWKHVSTEELVQPGTKLRSCESRKEISPMTEENLKHCCVIVYRIYLAHAELENLPHKTQHVNLKMYRLHRDDPSWEEMVFLHGSKSMWAFSTSFVFNTVKHKEIRVVLSRSGGIGCLRREKTVATAQIDVKSKFDKMSPNERAVSLEVDLKSENDVDGIIKLHIDGAVDRAIPLLCDLTLQKDNFVEQKLTTDELRRIWGHAGFPDSFRRDQHACCGATHILTNHENEESFRCRIMHIPELLHAGVEIFFRQKLVATAHLVGSSQLPYPSQVSSPDLATAFDPELGERAMLIRNHTGDWGLCVARWNQDDVVGLDVRFMKLAGRNKVQHVEIVTADVEFQSFNSNLYSGKLMVNPSKNTVAENLATFWSICVLYVLCCPHSAHREIMVSKPAEKPADKISAEDHSDEEERKPVYVKERNCQFLVAAGLGAQTPSNQYVLAKYGSLTYDLHMDAQDIIVEECKTPRRLLKKESVISVTSENGESHRKKSKRRSSKLSKSRSVDTSESAKSPGIKSDEPTEPNSSLISAPMFETQQSVTSDVEDNTKVKRVKKIKKRQSSALEDMLSMSDDSITKDDIIETELRKDDKGRKILVKKITTPLVEDIAPSDDSLDEEIKEKEEFVKSEADDKSKGDASEANDNMTVLVSQVDKTDKLLVSKESMEYDRERTSLIREVAEKKKRIASANSHMLPGTVTSGEEEDTNDSGKVSFEL